MTVAKRERAPKSHTVHPPSEPLAAPPPPPPPPPPEQVQRQRMLLNLDLSITRLHRELAYFASQMDQAWEAIDDFDELPFLPEINIALVQLREKLATKVEKDNLIPKPAEPIAPTRITVQKAE